MPQPLAGPRNHHVQTHHDGRMTSPPQCSHWGTSPFRGGFICPQPLASPNRGGVSRAHRCAAGPLARNGDREAVERFFRGNDGSGHFTARRFPAIVVDKRYSPCYPCADGCYLGCFPPSKEKNRRSASTGRAGPPWLPSYRSILITHSIFIGATFVYLTQAPVVSTRRYPWCLPRR